jgi:hypothetical protein
MECKHPHLGLATTRELLDELRARIELHALGGLDYRTVDGEKFAKDALGVCTVSIPAPGSEH